MSGLLFWISRLRVQASALVLQKGSLPCSYMSQSWPGKKPCTQSRLAVLATVLHGPLVVALGYWVVGILGFVAVARSFCWAPCRTRSAAASSKALAGAATSMHRHPTNSQRMDFLRDARPVCGRTSAGVLSNTGTLRPWMLCFLFMSFSW